jgi:hypothetical protein
MSDKRAQARYDVRRGMPVAAGVAAQRPSGNAEHGSGGRRSAERGDSAPESERRHGAWRSRPIRSGWNAVKQRDDAHRDCRRDVAFAGEPRAHGRAIDTEHARERFATADARDVRVQLACGHAAGVPRAISRAKGRHE